MTSHRKTALLALSAACFAAAALLPSLYSIVDDHVELVYPEIVRFVVGLTDAADIESIDLVYDTDGRSCQTATVRQPVDFEPGTEVQAAWEWELKRSGTLPPGVTVRWNWEFTDSLGNLTISEPKSFEIQDPNHAWQEVAEDGVLVQWYTGNPSFGEEMHTIALASLDKLEQDMGIRPVDDIIITIYPSAADVREAVLFSPDWTGGVAFPAFNATVIGVGPGELDWARQVIPHELAHLVVGTLTFNCRGVSLPTWLDEGLARVAEDSLAQYDINRVIQALRDDALPRLTSLGHGFSAFGDAATLSYAQSGMVVQYLIDTFGPAGITDLLARIQSGQGVDTALAQTYGLDTNGLDAAWRRSLGFEADFGEATPAPEATAVPTLALVVPGFATADPAAEPTASPTPETVVLIVPSPTEPPTAAVPASGPAPGAETRTGSSSPVLPVAAGILLILGSTWVLFRLRRNR